MKKFNLLFNIILVVVLVGLSLLAWFVVSGRL